MPFIFISYSHKDREYAHRLADSLEAKGLEVWIDDRIDYGETWPDVIEVQVDGCSALIVVMTLASHKSKWVKNELSRAQRKGKPVFPLLLEGDVWLSVEATQYVDVLDGSLPPDRFYSEVAGVMSAGQPQPKPEPQIVQWAIGGTWWLLSGLAAVIAAIAVIAFMANVIPPRQPPAPVVPAAGEGGGKETVGAIVDLPTQTPTFAATPAPTRGPTNTLSSIQGPDATTARLTATPAATSTPVPVGTFASEAVILTGDIMTVTSPIEMELVRVPAGEFLMGSDPAKDSQVFDNEQPQHRVNLSEYYIGKYEVTNAQYQAFVRATRHAIPSHWENGSIPAGKEDHPVVNVSWNDAIAFTDWLSATTGLAFRLPTEAEWEKSCRGTEGLIYPWGDYAPNSGNANFNRNVGDTTSVGSYSPKGNSPYGVADMAGNVWEWTSSQNKGYPYDANDGRENLVDDVSRVLRGGSFLGDSSYVRCAVRDDYSPGPRFVYIGFRLVCVSPPIMPLESGHSPLRSAAGLRDTLNPLEPEYSASKR